MTTRTSVWSAVREIEFYETRTVSVDENALPISPTIYPVPAKNVLHIDNIKPFNSLTIHDINGHKVLEQTLSNSVIEVKLDISSISNGIYFITLFGEQQYQSKQFVILD